MTSILNVTWKKICGRIQSFPDIDDIDDIDDIPDFVHKVQRANLGSRVITIYRKRFSRVNHVFLDTNRMLPGQQAAFPLTLINRCSGNTIENIVRGNVNDLEVVYDIFGFQTPTPSLENLIERSWIQEHISIFTRDRLISMLNNNTNTRQLHDRIFE